ncbi:helix-turn-helix domain-containing protein [Streptomyces uncialis]|uniref:helix-turn-helix domain-containing protein n=1 Tax=Streptomyces uncialis TaxID=1048205 RepID=UPI00386C64C2|nr:helix-turn-helix domain-containing protein [Streptomyces uncialis]
MPPRDNPTARQVRLGVELRKLREQAARTAREAAGLLSTDQAKISHIEAGRIGVSEERIRRLTTFYGCADTALIEALCAISRERRGQFWFDEYRGVLAPDFLDVAELEWHALALWSIQSITVPGLFQTAGYARTLFMGVWPKLPSEEVEARIEHRMRRAAILDRESPLPCHAFIHESALRMRFGGRQVARQQLEHLLNVAERPAVTLRVIPFTSEEFIEATQPVVYATGVVPQLDTVRIDSVTGGSFLDAVPVVAHYKALLSRAEYCALDQAESRQLIHHIAREL